MKWETIHSLQAAASAFWRKNRCDRRQIGFEEECRSSLVLQSEAEAETVIIENTDRWIVSWFWKDLGIFARSFEFETVQSRECSRQGWQCHRPAQSIQRNVKPFPPCPTSKSADWLTDWLITSSLSTFISPSHSHYHSTSPHHLIHSDLKNNSR